MPLWQRQIDLLRALAPIELLVSARHDPAWRPLNAIFVADTPPSRGPLSGLSAALALTKTTHLIALAIDMPAMSETYLRFLSGQIEPGQGVLPMMGGHPEPLAAIYPVEAGPDFSAALAGADFSLRSITARLVEAGKLRAIPVSPDHERFFRNVNDPLAAESL
jgi:molybdopterin-guanine dinucleotide biosynthesis protein A